MPLTGSWLPLAKEGTIMDKIMMTIDSQERKYEIAPMSLMAIRELEDLHPMLDIASAALLGVSL